MVAGVRKETEREERCRIKFTHDLSRLNRFNNFAFFFLKARSAASNSTARKASLSITIFESNELATDEARIRLAIHEIC